MSGSFFYNDFQYQTSDKLAKYPLKPSMQNLGNHNVRGLSSSLFLSDKREIKDDTRPGIAHLLLLSEGSRSGLSGLNISRSRYLSLNPVHGKVHEALSGHRCTWMICLFPRDRIPIIHVICKY